MDDANQQNSTELPMQNGDVRYVNPDAHESNFHIGKIITITIILVILIGVGALVWFIAQAFLINPTKYNGAKLDAESKAYVDREVPAIFGNWNSQELIDNSDPQMLATIPESQMQATFAKDLSLVGPIVSYDGSVGQSGIATFPDKVVITASYVSRVHFQHSLALISLSLSYNNNQWKISHLGIAALPEATSYPPITPPIPVPNQ